MISLLKSNKFFYGVASFLIVALFLPSAFLSVAVALFFVYACLDSDWNFNRAQSSIFLLPVILFALFLAGCLYAADRPFAFTILFRKIPLLLLPLSFIFLDKTKFKNSDFLLLVFAGTCILCSVYCYGHAMMEIIKTHSLTRPGEIRAGDYYFSYRELAMPTGIDPIYLSLYSNLALIIILKTPFVKNRITRGLIAVYLSIFIFLLAAKIGIVMFTVVLVIWIMTGIPDKRLSWLLLIFLVPLLWLGVTRFPFLKERFNKTTKFDYAESDSGQWTSSTFRLAIWSCARQAIEQKPAFGYGTGGGQAALEQVYRERNFVRGQLDKYNAHNEFLNTILDIGIIGCVFLLYMLTVATRAAIRAKDIVMICFMISIVLCFCVESVLLRQKGIVFFSFFYSLLFWRLKPVTTSAHDV